MTPQVLDTRAFTLIALVITLIAPDVASGQASRRLPEAGAGAGDVCSSAPARAHLSEPQQLLLAQECAVLRAVNELNAGALERLIAEDFSLVTVNGRMIPAARSEMIKRWTAQPPVGEHDQSRLREISRVEVTGNAGYVVGTIEDRSVKGAVATCQIHAFTDLWQRRGTTWNWVHAHESGARPAPCEPPR